MLSHFNAITLSLTATLFLAMVLLVNDSNSNSENENFYQGAKMPETQYFRSYEELKAPQNAVVVYPIFTQSAYGWGGIHDYYMGYCESCSTTEIQHHYDNYPASSGNGYRILEFLGYTIIDDVDLDKNPDILNSFDKVILLHNEYVTKSQFEAITNHPKVIFLYPGALSSLVQVDYSNNTMTLIRGPGYPHEDITNGFDWKYDNSEKIDNWDCNNWEFFDIKQGSMLNCYPEKILENNGFEILKFIKNF